MACLDALWSVFQPGRTIYVPGATGESRALATALRDQTEVSAGVRFVSGLVPGMNETVDYGGLAPECTVTTCMLPACMRDSFARGRVRLLPRTYWGTARYLQIIACDVAIAHVAPPNADGWCSLGVASDFTPLVWPNAHFKVLLVNPAMPILPRARMLPLADADLVVTLEGPLVEAPVTRETETATAIARTVAGLIPDGAHIQTGIGSVPDRIWTFLRNHRGLVLRSGMANPGLRELAEAGALAAGGAHLAGIAYGSVDFYNWLRDTDLVEFATTLETHGLPGLAATPRLHSINAALEVDLFGQVNVEWQGSALSSGVGGGPDFMRAATFSPGGRSIIALPATAERGTVSRIVTRLARPSVSVARSDIDTVVTEYGVAELRDKGIDERAQALIAVAAPQLRGELEEEWRALRVTFG